MFALIGAGSFASTIATMRAGSEGCFATTATSRSGTQKPRQLPSLLPNTSDFTLDEVSEVTAAGVEEVFDIQVDDTENFIANGLVSHNTRWHEDDLAGRLLLDAASGGDKWDVISLPAIAEANDPLGRSQGEALWPEWEPTGELDRKRRAVGPRDWSALYQQRPAPEEGDYFQAEWLRPYDKVPPRETLRVYGGSDYAVTADGGDYTTHVVLGLDPEGRLYLLDLWRKQAASDVWVEAFCDLVAQWKPIGWAEEQGQIKSGIGPYLDRRQRERRAYVVRDAFPTRGDKAVRAQSIRGRMALDKLYVPTHAPWYPAFRSELLSFPAGKFDDQVDALGLVGQLLDKMMGGFKPRPVEKVVRDKYSRERPGEINWKTA